MPWAASKAGFLIDIQFVGRSDVGRRRSHNEDSFYFSNAHGFGIVCDGMGGHQGGEIASRLAVETISRFASEVSADLVASREFTLGKLKDYAREQIVTWTKEANIEVFQKGLELSDGKQKRMGTTLCLLMLVADFAVIAHAGDSRIYRFRGGELEGMTVDHVTTVHNHVSRKTGKVRAKKYVTRALGTHPTVTPECRTVDLKAGDLFLLCSDGLTDLVKDQEIQSVLSQAGDNTQLAVRSLIHLANQRGGIDNVTVVIGTVVVDDEDTDDDTDDLSGDLEKVRRNHKQRQ